jgi:tetratricopeptide (TPR) repeat protein
MRRYAEATAAFDRAVNLNPQDVDARVDRAVLDLRLRADPNPLHEIETVFREKTEPSIWIELFLCERDSVGAGRALPVIAEWCCSFEDGVPFSGAFMKGCVARAFGDDAAAQNAFTAARVQIENIVRQQPNYGGPLCMLGLIDAGLGRKEEAISEGRRASELTPVAKDAVHGAEIMRFLGVIYAWTGEKNLAVKQIAETLQIPSHLGYGELRLHPYWDPLRGDPRFEKLVEEAKKPVALK